MDNKCLEIIDDWIEHYNEEIKKLKDKCFRREGVYIMKMDIDTMCEYKDYIIILERLKEKLKRRIENEI